MSVNLAILYSIDDTVDADLIIHQVGKGGCFFEIKIGYMSRIQIKFFKSVIGKITTAPFRVYIVDIIIILRMGNLRSCHPFFPDDLCRCLAHAERIDKEPCCHGQRREDPAYFQGFGFGLFAAAFRAVVSVCHRSYLLSVLFFSICSSFCCQKENLLLTGHPPLPGMAPGPLNSYPVYLKRGRHGEIHTGAAYFIIVEVLLEGESYA